MRRLVAIRSALWVLLAVLTGSAAAQTPFVLDGLGHATTLLNGQWQFHIGDNLAWASPTLDDSTWQPIQTGRSWEGQGHRNYTGFAWYRRRIVVPPGTPANLDLALYLPPVDDAAEVYWNGKLVGSSGKLPPHPVWYLAPTPQAFQIGPAQSGVLAIRVWSAPIIYLNYPEQGGLYLTPKIGTTEGVAALQTASRYHWLQNNQFTFAVCLVSAVVGLLAIFSWLRDRTRWMLFWLAIPMLKPIVGLVIFGIPGFSTFRLGYGSIGEVVAVSDVAIWFLLLYLLDLRSNARLLRWTGILACISIGMTLVDTVMVLLDWTRLFPHKFVYFDVGSTIPVELLEMYVLAIVAFALRKRLDLARWMLAMSTVLAEIETGLTDMSGLGVRWTHWTLHHQLYRPLFSIAGTPINISALVNLFLLVSILYAAWRYSVEQNQRQNLLEQEFRSAQEIQQLLIPEALPSLNGYSVTSAYKPAQEVGGDFFQIIPLPGSAENSQSAIIVLGDVSGKGLKAAMTVSLLVGAIRSTVETTQDPAQILTALNRRLHGRMQSGFATCLVLLLNPEGRCVLASAGHPAPFLNAREIDLQGALPLGLLPDSTYDESTVLLTPGDHLVLYTDGLLEAQTPAGEIFGFERLQHLMAAHPQADQALAEAQAFGQEDDITVLTLTRLAVGEKSSTQLIAPALAPA